MMRQRTTYGKQCKEVSRNANIKARAGNYVGFIKPEGPYENQVQE